MCVIDMSFFRIGTKDVVTGTKTGTNMPTTPPFFTLPPRRHVCTPETLRFYDSELARLRRVFDALNTQTRLGPEERREIPGNPPARVEAERSVAPHHQVLHCVGGETMY